MKRLAHLGKVGTFAGCALALGSDSGSKLKIFWRQTKNVRVRLGLAHHEPGRTFEIDTTYGRLHLRDNFGDITNVPNLLWREVYQLPAPVSEGAILDVGANIGLAAVWFRTRVPGHPIHCFEPLAENTRMVRLNCPEAVVNTVAVGSEPGEVELQVDRDAVMGSSISTRWATQPRKVPVVTLDDYTDEHGIENVAVLKVDTEGMELNVFAGAPRTLARTAQVAMETHGRDRHDRAIEILRNAGMRIARADFDGDTGMVFAVRG